MHYCYHPPLMVLFATLGEFIVLLHQEDIHMLVVIKFIRCILYDREPTTFLHVIFAWSWSLSFIYKTFFFLCHLSCLLTSDALSIRLSIWISFLTKWCFIDPWVFHYIAYIIPIGLFMPLYTPSLTQYLLSLTLHVHLRVWLSPLLATIYNQWS